MFSDAPKARGKNKRYAMKIIGSHSPHQRERDFDRPSREKERNFVVYIFFQIGLFAHDTREKRQSDRREKREKSARKYNLVLIEISKRWEKFVRCDSRNDRWPIKAMYLRKNKKTKKKNERDAREDEQRINVCVLVTFRLPLFPLFLWKER